MSLHVTEDKRCIELLRQLVGFRTDNPGGDERAICDFLAEQLTERGADAVDVVDVPRRRNGVDLRGAYVFARFGNPRTLLNSHVDTVPANRGWTSDPFTAVVTDDRVVGLGTCDTKGAAAAILTALERTEARDIGVLFSGDEEARSTVVPVFLASEHRRGIERAIVCEPTGRRAGVRHRGIMVFHAYLRGRGGHSSAADHLPKPLVELSKLAVALDELGRSYLQLGPDDMKGICFNIAQMDGGVAANVVPEEATLTVSLRPYPGFDAEQFAFRMAEIATEINPAIEVRGDLAHPPFQADNPDWFRALLGDAPDDVGPLQFWTEAALFDHAGIDAVVIGPGAIEQAHAADEFVTRDDLAWATEMFHHVLGVAAQPDTDR